MGPKLVQSEYLVKGVVDGIHGMLKTLENG